MTVVILLVFFFLFCWIMGLLTGYRWGRESR